MYYEKYASMRNDSRKTERKISEVTVRGTKTLEMPMWIINYYIKSTCDNYAKLVYILTIMDILSDKDTDIVDIGISTGSVPVDQDGIDFESKLIGYVRAPRTEKDKEKYCLMSYIPEDRKEGDGKKDFWHYFSSCERPVCFAITKQGEVIFLYDPRGAEGIKVCDISYHSPIDIGLGGVGAFIEHLVNADVQIKNDRRQQEEHDANMLQKAVHTLGETIDVREKLENANLSAGHKAYMQNVLDALLEKQARLNETIGIDRSGMDVRR